MNEYLERREQEDVADGAGLSEWEPQPSPEPTLYSGPQVAAGFITKAMAMLRGDSYDIAAITDATDSAEMAAAVKASAPEASTVHLLPFTYDVAVITHDGTPASPRGGRVNLRVTVQLDAGTRDVRGGLNDTRSVTTNPCCAKCGRDLSDVGNQQHEAVRCSRLLLSGGQINEGLHRIPEFGFAPVVVGLIG